MKRDSLVWGVILILIGVGFLIYQWFPELFGGFQWPWIILAIGAIFTVASLLTRSGGMLIPGLTLLTLGGIFTYQTNSGNWESWSYLWALMPGSVGLALVLGGLYDRELRQARTGGLIMLAVSLLLFAIFGGFFGLEPSILRYWPVVLIILGAVVFFRALRPRTRE